MGRPKTKKRRPRLPGVGLRLGTALAVLIAVAGVFYALLRLAGGSPALAEEAEKPAPTARPTATPAPIPVPTPEPPAVDLSDWKLRLIRYEYPLGEDFVPEDLTVIEGNERMDGRVAPYMKELIANARAAGYSVYVCSGYRDYETQSIIYWRHIYDYQNQGMTYEEADAKTRLAVNYPGCSEHQSGLTADILEYSTQPMEPYIGGSGLMLWLEEHCAEYGFVIRYPDGKTDITGVEYEPWHLRYVGEEAAAYIMENNLCLEEFLAICR